MTTTLGGVGIGRGIAIGPVIRMPDPLPEPHDTPSALDPDAENEFREKLYRAALQSISAITYAEWVSARETAGPS